jgi:anti-sigma regulatory factor (Ser/Thr protein kinase)
MARTGAVRIEVEDPGAGFEPTRPRRRGDLVGGFGLYLTEQLADRWGVDRLEGKTRVWLERRTVPPGT